MSSYRVFVSYSHEDARLVEAIVDTLVGNDLTVLWDRDLAGGRAFSEQIRLLIAHAHVFVPIITPSSSARGWVHQEIGFALASRVPVLPICQGPVPGEMLHALQGIHLDASLTELPVKLSRAVFDALLLSAERETRPFFECAMQPEDRAELLAEYADRIRTIPIGGGSAHGRVRQKAVLGTFGIPDRHVRHPVWDAREGRLPRGDHRRERLLKERRALEKHARVEGCRLILKPTLDFDRAHGPGAARARLQTMLEFLTTPELPAGKVEVALIEPSPRPSPHAVTLVGDWFLAESVTGDVGTGYRQTMVTRHAPTVRNRLEAFDAEFDESLRDCGVRPESSREFAIHRLEQLLAGLPAGQDDPRTA